MELLVMTNKTLTTLYKEQMTVDFPKDELKPLALLQTQFEKGFAFGYLLQSVEQQTLGYAIFAGAPTGTGALLLDYFAVDQSLRGQGIGSRFLTLLYEALSAHESIFIEAELPARAVDATDERARLRRIGFYLQNGCQMTEIENCLFGVDFAILQRPCRRQLTDEEVLASLEQIYQTMLTKERYQQFVTFSKRDNKTE